MVVADHLTLIVNAAFAPFAAANSPAPIPHDGLRLLITMYAFALQIYCDFSGYTDMARGTARLLGFDIMLNFNLPYAARDPSDFWKRWHISLSSWLRDYLYIPLGGSRHGTFNTYRNLMLTMLLGGLWHGAAWTFVLWGAYHGFLLVIYRVLSIVKERWTSSWRTVLNSGLVLGASSLVAPQPAGPPVAAAKPRAGQDQRSIWLRSGVAAVQVLIMFHLVCLGWLLFRAPNMTSVGVFLHAITLHPHWSPETTEALRPLVLYSWFFVLFEVIQAWTGSLQSFHHWPWFVRLNIWLFVILSLLALAAGGGKEFIYFAF
jgi:D-alanyl-lipoteichoic acid acyltransferase DltB (MBOAT superfamily)